MTSSGAFRSGQAWDVGAPPVSADVTNPLRDVDAGPGFAGIAGLIPMILNATMVKRLDQAFAPGGIAGAPAGACDVGAKGDNQIWTIFLIGNPDVGTRSPPGWQRGVQLITRASGLATMVAPGHGLGVGSSIFIDGYVNFLGGWTINGVSGNNVTFESPGPDVPASVWGNDEFGMSPYVAGFDVLASQNRTAPTLPAPFIWKCPIATVTTDGSGNIATVTPIAVPPRN
jgi:hypothetical protein